MIVAYLTKKLLNFIINEMKQRITKYMIYMLLFNFGYRVLVYFYCNNQKEKKVLYKSENSPSKCQFLRLSLSIQKVITTQRVNINTLYDSS